MFLLLVLPSLGKVFARNAPSLFLALWSGPLLFLPRTIFAQDTRSCNFPDGTPSRNDTPCTSGNGEAVCCGQGFACLEDGVCQVTSFAFQSNPDLNTGINYYRGSCTDQSWSSPDCPQFCIGSQCVTPPTCIKYFITRIDD